MFETIQDTLALCGIFGAAGLLLAVLYNIFRFVRLAFPGLRFTAAVLDILFALIAGLTLFIMSAEYGSGAFRLYYVFAAAVGFAANMLTVGFAVPPLARLFSRLCGALWRLAVKIAGIIAKPVSALCTKVKRLFIAFARKIRKIAENSKIRLQRSRQKVYNNTNRTIGEVRGKDGERGNVIKAKVRKIV
ncbi:MAG: spore cortex biosynthesis protein YabQ [Ruminiclostridium sp.]|nr:spore cortex biosynthesis protein YabQ [Ruminiclostridium sp.]